MLFPHAWVLAKDWDGEDFTRLRAHHPTWIPERFWHQMIDEVWDTECWKHTSRVNKANRNTEFKGVSSRHTGGSISTAQHRYQMRRILGREPSSSEVYERVHCTNRKLVPGSSNPPTDPPQYIYPKAARVEERFLELRDAAHSSAQPDTPPPDDASLWDQSIGGRKKGRYFGLGDSYYSEYSNSSGRSSTTGSSMEVDELKEKMIRMEAEAKEREDRYVAQLESEQKRREDLETEQANQAVRLAEQVALSAHFASFMQQQGYNFPPPGPSGS
ncbi:hypothetical protein L6452_10307 [Arctium lappa]|uniref:Uncharacterized protein n=1 Tax=Arctium lappa TaxID=4217 RepID=A0ACB9DMP3_ARCLA|nr:hypothetical protein L6452_10307 [Arctium lappa]